MSKNYFTADTEKAIIEYNNEINIKLKNKIYEDRIHYAFYKLTENLIHTFKFYYTDVEILQDLQFEIINYLIDRLHLFHHSKNINDRIRKIIVKKCKGIYLNDFISYTNNAPQVDQEQINSFIKILDLNLVPADTLDFCITEIKKITPPKAYSYFGTVAKRYLIIYNKDNYKKRIESIPVNNLEPDENSKQNIYHENLSYNMELENGLNKHDKLSDFMDDFIDYCTENIYTLFPDKNGVEIQDARIADAVLELFRKRNQIDVFNKKALYIYIREIIDVKTPKITKIVNKLYDMFKEKWIFYLENGYYEFKYL